jgi:serine/threonine-protein kinase
LSEDTGTLIAGRYRVGERIREGRAFRLHEGSDTQAGGGVRVRLLRPYLWREPTLRVAFRRLTEGSPPPLPGLLTLLVVEPYHDTVALVEEAPEGECLADRLRREVVLAPAEAVDLTKRAATVIQGCHEAGVVHGMLSPQELHLTAAGAVEISGCGFTQPFSGKGLPGAEDNPYLAPEQRRGEHALSQSDVYALAVILLEALTGRPPTPESLKSGDWKRGVPSGLQPLLESALAESARDRPTSAAALLAALDGLKRDLSAAPAPPPAEAGPEAPPEEPVRPRLTATPDRAQNVATPRKPAARVTVWARLASCLVGLIYASIIPVSVGVPVYLVYTKWMEKAPETVVVPDFQGIQRDLNDAQRDARELGLSLSVVDEVFNPDIGDNRIVWQNPAPGKVVKEGFGIDVKISRAARAVAVPNVINTNLEEAERKLKEMNLRVGDVQKGHSRTFPQDIVFSQAPEPGETIPEGGQVNLLASLGPDPSENWEGLDDPAVPSVPGSVRFEVPSSGNEDEPHRIQVKVFDQKGSRVVYDRLHMQGETVRVPFTVMGDGRVEVIRNGEVEVTKQVPE